MNINIKVLIAAILGIGIIFWAVSGSNAVSYSGENLSFSTSGGTISILNTSDEAIPVQLTGDGIRSFSVLSETAGVRGSSTTQGTGTARTQLFEFELPSGISEFTISRGTNVIFQAVTPTNLEATVYPLSDSASSMTTIVAVVVVLGLLFYMSKTTDHGWINQLRGKVGYVEPVVELKESSDGGQGAAARTYGDNRSE